MLDIVIWELAAVQCLGPRPSSVRPGCKDTAYISTLILHWNTNYWWSLNIWLFKYV